MGAGWLPPPSIVRESTWPSDAYLFVMRVRLLRLQRGLAASVTMLTAEAGRGRSPTAAASTLSRYCSGLLRRTKGTGYYPLLPPRFVARSCHEGPTLRTRSRNPGGTVTGWRLTGPYLEACNCEAICPCRSIGGRDGSRAQYQLCQFAIAWTVGSGHFGELDMAGLQAVMAGYWDEDEPGVPGGCSSTSTTEPTLCSRRPLPTSSWAVRAGLRPATTRRRSKWCSASAKRTLR